MIIKNKITPLCDPTQSGETLLTYLNSNDRWGYNTTDFVNSNWVQIYGEPELLIRTLLCGCLAKTEAVTGIHWYQNLDVEPHERLYVFLYWDGDGTVLFQYDNFQTNESWFLINDDCKKSNGWEWLDTNNNWAIGVIKEKNYFY